MVGWIRDFVNVGLIVVVGAALFIAGVEFHRRFWSVQQSEWASVIDRDVWFDPRWGVERQKAEGQKWRVGNYSYRTRDLMGMNI